MNSNNTAAILIQRAFEVFLANPPDLRENNGQAGEIRYVQAMLPSYNRTIMDILQLFPGDNGVRGLNVVEIGAFLGIVSKALNLASAKVVACDIPEFFERNSVKGFYQSMGLEIRAFNLRDYDLPFSPSSQDCVIACEIFEHLNFNPLPVFAEINRILKLGGYLYLATPNGGYFLKRLRYLFSGMTPGFTIDQLFAQLAPGDNKVVSLHWKEYSMAQTIQMVSPLGFEVVQAKTIDDPGAGKQSVVRKLLKTVVPGGATQVVIFKKVADFQGVFSVCADS